MAGSSALAVAQPNDHRDGRQEDRGRSNTDRGGNFNKGGGNFNKGGRDFNNGGRNFNDDRGRNVDNDNRFRGKPNGIYWRDNDADRHFDRDRGRVVVTQPYFVGERHFFNGYYWTWDGDRWCRRDNGIQIFFRF